MALQVQLRHQIRAGPRLDVTFRVDDECVVLFGASGAGKTTILRLIAGLVRPDEGLVCLSEKVLCETSKHFHETTRKRRIGFIYQDDLLFPHLDVAGNVRFGLACWGRTEAEHRLAETAALCHVDHLLSRSIEGLSGGERQRVGLARALAPRPRLLLCDEPVSALDVSGRDVLLQMLASVRKTERVPMIYVTHAPAEAVTVGDRLLLLDDGRIVEEGRPLDVLARIGPRGGLADLRNVHEAQVAAHEVGATRLQVPGGPELIVPRCGAAVGARVVVTIRADDVLLAKSGTAPLGLSARNVIPGVVERIVAHEEEAEVVVATGSVRWVVSVVSPALAALCLHPGSPCTMIFKARGCHLLPRD